MEDVQQIDARVLISIHGSGPHRKALKALGGRREFLCFGRWLFPADDSQALAGVLSALQKLGLPFLGAGPGWHPGAVFEELRDRGLVSGPYRMIYWTGPGQWHIRDA